MINLLAAMMNAAAIKVLFFKKKIFIYNLLNIVT